MALVYFGCLHFLPGSWTSLPNGPIPSLPRLKKPFFLPTTRKLRQGHIPTTLQVPTQVFFSFLCFSVGLPSTALKLLSGSQPLLRVQNRGCEQFPLETGQRVPIPPATLRGSCACTPAPPVCLDWVCTYLSRGAAAGAAAHWPHGRA